ncbi:MAG: cupin domain-containing protein [Betaproteobacteria bacterium]
MSGPLPSFEAFRAEWLGQGYDEVLAREWAPGQVVPEHRHPFDAQVLVVRGSLVLGCAGEQRALQAGDCFGLPAGVPHTEHYGPEGASFWVARRNPR